MSVSILILNIFFKTGHQRINLQTYTMASSASRFCKEILTKVGYGKLSCKLWGENVRSAEKFVALHGWLDNAGSFDPLMEKFLTKGLILCNACVNKWVELFRK